MLGAEGRDDRVGLGGAGVRLDRCRLLRFRFKAG